MITLIILHYDGSKRCETIFVCKTTIITNISDFIHQIESKSILKIIAKAANAIFHNVAVDYLIKIVIDINEL